MSWTEAELHELAKECLLALLSGPAYVGDGPDEIIESAYRHAGTYLAEREKRGWMRANAAPAPPVESTP